MSKIGFIGCHEISFHCLKKICLLSKKYNDDVKIVFNLTSEEAAKHSASMEFDSLMKEFDFELCKTSDVSNSESIELLQKHDLDILFIIGWHRIVPQEVLNTAQIRLGIHSSLLPKDRGSSPINWQIIRGETIGGVTLFHLTIGVDSGNILDSKSYKIEFSDDVKDVYDKATLASLNLLEKNWGEIHELNPKSIPQNSDDSTINERRRPNDGLIDWNLSDVECYNWIRALTKPYPGAFTYYKNKKIYIWKAKISTEKNNKPGQIIEAANKIVVSTGKGSIEILEIQTEGELPCNSKSFLKSCDINNGSFFEGN